ncbi:MAG: GGDEF domain-containing protein [Planctomycetota bacterium]|jgi:diguanylate cyclase (GGDEF)-like protein|nr:GGDEF domain-containing protein [Planctomycetota bacterium]
MSLLASLVNLDTKSLIVVLFCGNITSFILLMSYRYTVKNLNEHRLFHCYSMAKICQAAGWILLSYRGQLPDPLSVNIGNSLLLLGFYLEAESILIISHEKKNKVYGATLVILIVSLVLFNGVEFIFPDAPLRVAVASFCVFCLFFIPTIRMMLSKDTRGFKRTVGIFYIIFISLQLPRTFFALYNNLGVLGNSAVQSLNFLSLIMLVILGLSAYLLLMKEYADQIIQNYAATDSLTGLLNRRTFIEKAQRHFDRHKSDKASLAVLLLDIDHFKTANDTFGYHIGEEMLKIMANMINQTLRVSDLSCRYVGETFVMLLPSITFEQASMIAERLMVQARHTTYDQRPELSFTASVGIRAGIPEPEETLIDFIDQADNNLHAVKKNSRTDIEPLHKYLRSISASDIAPKA